MCAIVDKMGVQVCEADGTWGPCECSGTDSYTAIYITAGWGHTCAVLDSGGVKCWGDNDWGQLGNGESGFGAYETRPETSTGLTSGVQAVAAGGHHTCALLVSGGVKCWGHNGEGQLGDGTLVDSSTPVDVVDLSSDVQAISAGSYHTCAVLDSGGVMCWGNNFWGLLGDGTTDNSSTPVDVVGLPSDVQTIAAGGWHTCAVLDSGGVMCWGRNDHGQLGDGTTDNSSTPVDVVDLSSDVQAISAGSYHTCAVLDSGGVKCWGDNAWGQLGNGTGGEDEYETTPVDVVGLSSDVQAVAAGGFYVDDSYTCALLTSGGVMCWGGNSRGQLGNGTTDDSSTPVDVFDLTFGVQAVAAAYAHTCAVLDSGGVKCWGGNWSGQLGDGTLVDSLTPVDVSGF